QAYPDCQAIPCNQFEVAFQAAELLFVDCVVLPVETSLIKMFIIRLMGVVDHQALTPGLHFGHGSRGHHCSQLMFY
ncbi:unnamed protein product, partial [Brassica rapa subsp. narinosa]